MPPKKAKPNNNNNNNRKPRVTLPPPHLRTEEQQYMYVHQFERNVTCTGVEHGSTLSLTPGSVAVARDVLFSETGQQRKRLLWIGCAEGAEVRSMALQCPDVHIDAIDINENCIHIADVLKRKLETKHHFAFPKLRFHRVDLLSLTPQTLEETFGPVTHVYTTAVAGDTFYAKVWDLCMKTASVERLVAFTRPHCAYWRKHLGFSDDFVAKGVVHLRASSEQRTLGAINTNVERHGEMRSFGTVSSRSSSPTSSSSSSSSGKTRSKPSSSSSSSSEATLSTLPVIRLPTTVSSHDIAVKHPSPLSTSSSSSSSSSSANKESYASTLSSSSTSSSLNSDSSEELISSSGSEGKVYMREMKRKRNTKKTKNENKNKNKNNNKNNNNNKSNGSRRIV